MAITFSMYSSQWLAVIGFLPAVYAQAGLGAAQAGALTALASWINVTGNIASGRLLRRQEEVMWRCLNCGYLHRGTTPPDKCPACVKPPGHFAVLASL